MNGEDLAIPPAAKGLVIFAHGSGSSRFSPRNRAVASSLREGGIGTLLIDLLTPEEERVDALTGEYRFDIELLTERLVEATRRSRDHRLPVGYFGASTGAAAALKAAAVEPVSAVVSRGGRPDLAAESMKTVKAPTLLIVGGNDEPVIALNRQAMKRMTAPVRLEIVPGATHLFEEPGALEQVAGLARDWFLQHFKR